MSTEDGTTVVRRNTEEVQGRGNFEVFEELFADDFVDHTPQPGGFTPDRDGARNSYSALRAAFPDFHAEIHWQISDGDRVTTYKTYHGTHEGDILVVSADRAQDPFRDCGWHARARRQDYRSLGSRQFFSLAQQLGLGPRWTPGKKTKRHSLGATACDVRHRSRVA
jgi:SnoaL-like polyketide cyclase